MSIRLVFYLSGCQLKSSAAQFSQDLWKDLTEEPKSKSGGIYYVWTFYKVLTASRFYRSDFRDLHFIPLPAPGCNYLKQRKKSPAASNQEKHSLWDSSAAPGWHTRKARCDIPGHSSSPKTWWGENLLCNKAGIDYLSPRTVLVSFAKTVENMFSRNKSENGPTADM